MTPTTHDPDEVRNSSPADLAGGPYSNENRAAYFLARNIYLVEGWLFAVQQLAGSHHAFDWSFPNTLSGPFCDAPPMHLFADIDEALRALAIAGGVNAAILIELRRSLDAAAESCARLAELVRDDDREEIRGNYWSLGYDIYNAKCLLPRILSGSVESVSAWFRLGNQVGELLGNDGLPNYRERYWRIVNEILTEAPRVTTADMDRLRNIPILRQVDEISYEQFKLVGEVIDDELRRSLRSVLPSETWFILDDNRRVLTFLGVDVPYETFGTELDMVRVLVQHPRTPLSSSTIITRADHGAGAGQVAAYISRFRRALRATQDRWPESFRNDPGAYEAFILSDPAARKRANSKDTWYKLELPSHRVLHLAAAECI